MFSNGDADRASRRPEPPPSRPWRPPRRDVVRPRSEISAPAISCRCVSTIRCSSMRKAGGWPHEARSGSEGKTGAGARRCRDRTCRRIDQPRPGDRRRRSRIEHEAGFRGRGYDTARPCGKISAGDAEVDRNDAGHEGWRRFRTAGRHFLHGAWQGASESAGRAPISLRPRTRRSTAVKARGRSEAGQKTLLDVLVPVQACLPGVAMPGAITAEAEEAADRTTPMLATSGRASFLGESSIGHMDPGSRSASLLIARGRCDTGIRGRIS